MKYFSIELIAAANSWQELETNSLNSAFSLFPVPRWRLSSSASYFVGGGSGASVIQGKCTVD